MVGNTFRLCSASNSYRCLSKDDTDIWKAFYCPVNFTDKVVLDPFMGAGTTVGEALKLGCTVVGADINPISAFQVQKALEPVDVYELRKAFERVKNKVKPQIQQMYQAIDPDTGRTADILYCFWVMTVLCPHCKGCVQLFDTSIFAKHAYPKKVPTAQSVCFACGHINVTRYDAVSLHCKALLFCGDSSSLALPDRSVDVVVTDPPYFDFVHYSELADFFYSWLRLSLGQTRIEFSAETTRQPQEVQQRDARAFSTALGGVLRECTRVLKHEGLLIFSFHHSRNVGWEAVGQAIFDAGLGVVAAHLIKAEMSGASPKSQTSDPINYDAILVCKQLKTPVRASLETAIDVTRIRAREKLDTLSQDSHPASLSHGDRFVIVQSQALCVFSQHLGLMTDISDSEVTLSQFLIATSSVVNTFSAYEDEQMEVVGI